MSELEKLKIIEKEHKMENGELRIKLNFAESLNDLYSAKIELLENRIKSLEEVNEKLESELDIYVKIFSSNPLRKEDCK